MASCIPEISADTIIVYERLSNVKVGETVAYSELSLMLGRDVRGTSMLETARKKAQTDNGMVFGTVRGVGIKRLADTEIVNTASATFSHIQRTTKRERNRLSTVQFETLPKDAKAKHAGAAAALAVIHAISSPKRIHAIESKTGEGMQKLSMIQTIDAFREAEGGL